MQRFAVALFAFLAVLALVLPSQARITNAERLRRGEPLLPPVRRGTPTYAAKRQTPSGVAIPNTSGRIEVRTLDGTVLGHLQNDVAGPNHLNFASIANDAIVELAGGHIEVLNSLFTAPFFIGGVGSPILGGGVGVSTPLTNVGDASPTTWVIDASSKLIPTWTNPDGSALVASIFYTSSADSFLFIGGDEAIPGPAELVDFYLVD
ncbi:hypothetical protein FA95DRAFT_1559408 [Auriscalpium vulgare]|uniref:Uncharacterized protein n=1 Tax=Auriscalpium vulgare TaxID=40419 RepID=A0ACB8RTQ4_9AGAM|nr:hypothetical protein FA95DRAFT_1559408 [Auriscalpium vulgare]